MMTQRRQKAIEFLSELYRQTHHEVTELSIDENSAATHLILKAHLKAASLVPLVGSTRRSNRTWSLLTGLGVFDKLWSQIVRSFLETDPDGLVQMRQAWEAAGLNYDDLVDEGVWQAAIARCELPEKTGLPDR
jgi:hypothetical protein